MPVIISILSLFIFILLGFQSFSSFFKPYTISTERYNYLTIICLFYIFFGFIYSFVFIIFNQEGKKESHNLIRLYSLITIIFFIGFFYFPQKIYNEKVYNNLIAKLPKSLGVKEVIYKNEESWGIGLPGDNETGLIIYKLPENTAHLIEKFGINYLENLNEIQDINMSTRYDIESKWEKTPIKYDDRWKYVKKYGDTRIANYLCRYGFCIDVEEKYEKIAEQIISTEGSYYVYRRGGATLIISTHKQLIIYLYSG